MNAPFTSDSIVPIWIAVGVSGAAMLICVIHFVAEKLLLRWKKSGKAQK